MEQAQPAGGGGHELLHGAGAVGGVAVDDEEHRPVGVAQQPFAEVDERGGGELALVGGEPTRWVFPLRSVRLGGQVPGGRAGSAGGASGARPATEAVRGAAGLDLRADRGTGSAAASGRNQVLVDADSAMFMMPPRPNCLFVRSSTLRLRPVLEVPLPLWRLTVNAPFRPRSARMLPHIRSSACQGVAEVRMRPKPRRCILLPHHPPQDAVILA